MTIKAQLTVASAQRIGDQDIIYAATGADAAIPGDTGGGTVPVTLQLSMTLDDTDALGTLPAGTVLNVVVSPVPTPAPAATAPTDTAPIADTTQLTGDLNTPPATAPPGGDGQTPPNLPEGTPDPATGQTSDTPGPADFPPATPPAGGGLSADGTPTTPPAS